MSKTPLGDLPHPLSQFNRLPWATWSTGSGQCSRSPRTTVAMTVSAWWTPRTAPAPTLTIGVLRSLCRPLSRVALPLCFRAERNRPVANRGPASFIMTT